MTLGQAIIFLKLVGGISTAMLTVDQCVQQLNNNHDVVIEIECNYTDIKSAKIDLYTKLKKKSIKTHIKSIND